MSPGEYDLLWLSQFLALTNRRPNAVSVHLYVWSSLEESLSRSREFLRQACDLAQRYSIPEVWLTEWAGLPGYMGQADAEEYMRRMLSEVLPSFPIITRQAWFQVSYKGTEAWSFGPDNNTSLVGFYTGQLTPFGLIFQSRATTVKGDLNGDGCVDVMDIAVLGSNYMQQDICSRK